MVRSGSTDTIAQSLGDMVKNCEEIDFPQVRHDFSDTKIYWRKIEGIMDPSKAV
jgi:hypothetical protein